jgi:hypothetical protein
MVERLTGDSDTPEDYLDQRRQIMADHAAGLLTEAEASNGLQALNESNPTATAAYENNQKQQNDHY